MSRSIAGTILIAASLAASGAEAQRQAIDVLIDASYQATGDRFLDQVSERLAPDVRQSITFTRRVVPPSEIRSALDRAGWHIAIVSNPALVGARPGVRTLAFEMPFVFANTQSVVAFERSVAGRAALGTLPGGLTGLVYLNAGVSLLAGNTRPRSPEELKGRTIAVFTPLLQEPSKLLGMSPNLLPIAEIGPALSAGKVDSAIISSANPATWSLSVQRFVLANSVKANVALVVTRNAAWGAMPFAYRAMIGDAAIAVSAQNDQRVAESEGQLFREARSSDKLVSFEASDADRGTRQWIAQQPQPLRAAYGSAYDSVKRADSSPAPPPITPRSRDEGARIRFATTRDDTGRPEFAYRFGDDRTGVVKCGEIAGSAGDAAPEFAGPITDDSERCRRMLADALKASKRMLLFVHGFNNRFSEAADRALMLKSALGRDTEVVLWSWPSKRDALGASYDYDKESVTGEALQSFKRMLRALKPGAQTSPLDILAHSMGSWHTVIALRDLADDAGRPALRSVLFAAPDIPVNEFDLALADLRKDAKRITLYACDFDWALRLSRTMNMAPRAGTGGASDIIVDRRLDSIDVPAKLLSTNHSYVFEAGKVLNDVTALVVGAGDPAARGLVRYPKETWHYWSFP